MLLYSYCNGFKNNNFWGFILTMWYVNLLTVNILLSSGVSFILTMWYVNPEYLQIVIFAGKGFYINYVVCKYLQEELDLQNEYICFILTMWYVNLGNVSPFLKLLMCFILTMWYVN